MRALGLLAVFAGPLVLSACASNESATGDPAFNAFIEVVIEDARAQGVADSQLALLEGAKDEGYLSLSVTNEAINDTFACLDNAGVSHSLEEPGSEDSFIPPGYLFQDHSDEKTRLADDCIEQYSFFVESAFQSQPRAEAARQALFEAKLPEIVDCLQEQGEQISDGATTDEVLEIMRQPTEVWAEYIADSRPLPQVCMEMAGLRTW